MSRPKSVERLIETLGRFPSIGPKTSERLAYYLLRSGPVFGRELIAAVEAALASTVVCKTCFNLDETSPCGICADDSRDRGVVLVVEDPRDVTAFEESGYSGLYHVLQGRVSSVEGLGPEDLTIDALLRRVDAQRRAEGAVQEVCLATSPDLEGEGTASLLAEKLAKLEVNVTRIARGVPSGSTINQVSKSILADAIEGRRSIR